MSQFASVGGKRRTRKARKGKKSKAKVGTKSNPYKNKTAARKGRRSGTCYYKKKGRTLKMKKK